MALHIRELSFPVNQDFGADNKQVFLLKAPAADEGGKLRIVSASAVNGAATSGANGFKFTLHKYSALGTPAINGTVSTALGGTTDHWAAGVPKDFTLTAAQCLMSEGEWLVLQYNEDGTGNPTNATVVVKYLVGN